MYPRGRISWTADSMIFSIGTPKALRTLPRSVSTAASVAAGSAERRSRPSGRPAPRASMPAASDPGSRLVSRRRRRTLSGRRALAGNRRPVGRSLVGPRRVVFRDPPGRRTSRARWIPTFLFAHRRRLGGGVYQAAIGSVSRTVSGFAGHLRSRPLRSQRRGPTCQNRSRCGGIDSRLTGAVLLAAQTSCGGRPRGRRPGWRTATIAPLADIVSARRGDALACRDIACRRLVAARLRADRPAGGRSPRTPRRFGRRRIRRVGPRLPQPAPPGQRLDAARRSGSRGRERRHGAPRTTRHGGVSDDRTGGSDPRLGADPSLRSPRLWRSTRRERGLRRTRGAVDEPSARSTPRSRRPRAFGGRILTAHTHWAISRRGTALRTVRAVEPFPGASRRRATSRRSLRPPGERGSDPVYEPQFPGAARVWPGSRSRDRPRRPIGGVRRSGYAS
jgi:hypothetical protein